MNNAKYTFLGLKLQQCHVILNDYSVFDKIRSSLEAEHVCNACTTSLVCGHVARSEPLIQEADPTSRSWYKELECWIRWSKKVSVCILTLLPHPLIMANLCSLVHVKMLTHSSNK